MSRSLYLCTTFHKHVEGTAHIDRDYALAVPIVSLTLINTVSLMMLLLLPYLHYDINETGGREYQPGS